LSFQNWLSWRPERAWPLVLFILGVWQVVLNVLLDFFFLQILILTYLLPISLFAERSNWKHFFLSLVMIYWQLLYALLSQIFFILIWEILVYVWGQWRSGLNKVTCHLFFLLHDNFVFILQITEHLILRIRIIIELIQALNFFNYELINTPPLLLFDQLDYIFAFIFEVIDLNQNLIN
jgi:hypothetical protein